MNNLPEGFLYSGVTASIKESKNKDLALIYCVEEGRIGGVFTKNRFPAASVIYDQGLCPQDSFRAMIINSGNANAATGAGGVAANLAMATSLADQLKLNRGQVLTGSTGIIGQQLPIDKITSAIPKLVAGLSKDPANCSEAILTTDLKTKTAQASFEFEGNKYHVLGMTKGSGMIHPNMATMLGYIMTDAPLPKDIQGLTKKIADVSLNCISVDGDSSTNDSFFIMTSSPADCPAELETKVITALTEVSQSLAQQIAADGEGANHLIHLEIKNAASKLQAQSVLNRVLTSPLVKTAIHGQDPNWGRLMMAIGNGLDGEEVNPPISITLQGTPLFTQGEPVDFKEEELSKKMANFDVYITVDLNQGKENLTGWGCDLSREYIAINADYST